MKRNILLILLVSGLVAMISAQGWNRGNMSPRLPAAEKVSVSGSLVVAYGMPALKSGDVTYLLGGMNRLTGFIDGFKEGAQATIEGSAVTNPRDNNIKFLLPAKLTLNGKNYDLGLPEGGLGFYMHRNPPMPQQNFNRQQPRPRSAPRGRQPR